MPDASSADLSPDPQPGPAAWPRRVRIAMLALNFLPLLHLIGIGLVIVKAPPHLSLAAALATLYLLPPLLVRIILFLRPFTPGSHPTGSPVFLTWWATAQCQMLFCRLPFLEEILRLVPSLYSFWLRLWGAKIGRFTFWSPGLRLLDRSFLTVGDDVVFGAGARLNAHVLETVDGLPVLHLAPIVIGAHCQIGGYSVLGAGTVVEAGESLKSFTLSPPFTRWSAGRRARPAIPR